ncbi:tRNA pseudouridine(55) synthase TruB [Anaerocolumna sp. AGMB13025]|uniref:tRNA pseudouridine(55) synthase TruB n=1 Tax=Anaerocolumna sp. AGMB13025 TaxID=3039116 RepID=UPI00241FA093|nr:tRNA pseudouridine(55) synthase TruB [Anaerocolumna sp. AGMB13025]WFR54917.1 tRNA pseudouridine(55) synthase TruB [Anaerocolumna sp. AGMB13025]
MINGIINVYKEKGFTSHDVVAKLRGMVKQKKIGHTGTLDPDAEGVLPVCFGNATKLCDMLTEKSKTYEAVLKLGIVTDTQDITGSVLNSFPVTADRDQITKTILSFIGEYDQLPPMYSAIKVNGKRLYELARAGKEVERETRRVRISDIRILEFNEADHEVRISVDCSKGTYIRTLCHDIGERLNCGGCMKTLLRTRSGAFALSDSLKLSQIQVLIDQDKLTDILMKPEDMFPNYEKVVVLEEFTKNIYNGNSFRLEQAEHHTVLFLEGNSNEIERIVRVYDHERQFIGIYEYCSKDKLFKPVKMFL